MSPMKFGMKVTLDYVVSKMYKFTVFYADVSKL